MGRFYDERAMGKVREALEREVMGWPEVTKKIIFGCPSYRVREETFVFVATGAIILPGLTEEERKVVAAKHKAAPWNPMGKPMEKFLAIPVKGPKDLARLMPLVKGSHARAGKKKKR